MSNAAFAELLRRLVQAEVRFVLPTDLGRPDVVQGMEHVPTYDDLVGTSFGVDVFGVTVLVCSLEDLRAMKRAAGRPQDLIDLDNLAIANPDDC